MRIHHLLARGFDLLPLNIFPHYCHADYSCADNHPRGDSANPPALRVAAAHGPREFGDGRIPLFGNRTCRTADDLCPSRRGVAVKANIRKNTKRMYVGRNADLAARKLLWRGKAGRADANSTSIDNGKRIIARARRFAAFFRKSQVDQNAFASRRSHHHIARLNVTMDESALVQFLHSARHAEHIPRDRRVAAREFHWLEQFFGQVETPRIFARAIELRERRAGQLRREPRLPPESP